MGQSILQTNFTLQERAIRKLYTGEKKKYTQSSWRGSRRTAFTNPTSMTAEEVAELFGMTAKQVKVIRTKRIYWDEKTIVEYIMKFIRREGRWPASKDFNNAVANKIPSYNTLRSVMWARTRGGRRGYNAVQEHIARRKDITAQMVLTMPNITIRREAINNYGFDKMVKQKIAQKVTKDSFGILWHIPQNRDEDMFFVEVENKTPELDGTFAHYFLRVPAGMESAQQAVAWTFGVPTDQEWENFSIEVAT